MIPELESKISELNSVILENEKIINDKKTVYDEKDKSKSHQEYVNSQEARDGAARYSKEVREQITTIEKEIKKLKELPSKDNEALKILIECSASIENYKNKASELRKSKIMTQSALSSNSTSNNTNNTNNISQRAYSAAAAGVYYGAASNLGSTTQQGSSSNISQGTTSSVSQGISSNTEQDSSSNNVPEKDTSTSNSSALKYSENVDYSYNTMLEKDLCTSTFPVTADDLNYLFDVWTDKTGNYNSPLKGCGEYYIKASEETGIDPVALVAITGFETGRGGSNASGFMNNNNFFGMLYDDLGYFGATNNHYATKEEAIVACAKRIKSLYYEKHNGRSLHGLSIVGYCHNGEAKGYEYKFASMAQEACGIIAEHNS